MGTHSRSEIVVVLGMLCVIPLHNSNSIVRLLLKELAALLTEG
jgi:hypothetical protein